MAANVGPGPAHWSHAALARGNAGGDEDELLLHEILRLRDAVLAGTHPHLKLPSATLEQLRTALGAHRLPSTSPAVLPAAATRPSLDPIFLEKSDSLVRAEGRLKRQRIERELQAQVDQRKYAVRDKEGHGDGLARLDLDTIFRDALQRVPHISGLAPVVRTAHEKSASPDTNDYYSSRAPSAWSEDAGASRSPSVTVVRDAPTQSRQRPASQLWPSEYIPNRDEHEVTGVTLPAKTHHLADVEIGGNDDDDYVPPDAEAFDSFYEGADLAPTDAYYRAGPDDVGADDDSEYDPGDVTHDSLVATPQDHDAGRQQMSGTAVNFPVIRNHLTHIAAPQPERVSPLATAKGPDFQLELVNGRPELVQSARGLNKRASIRAISRGSTATPVTTPVTGSQKKKTRVEKRKREKELLKKVKRRKERPRDAYSPSSPLRGAPGVKKEPVSPPPYGVLQPAAQFTRPVAHVEAALPRAYGVQPQSHPGYMPEQGYPYAAVSQSVPTNRQIPKDTSDLRRVATLHQAQQSSAQAPLLPPAPSAPSTPTRPWQYTPSQPLLAEPAQAYRREITNAPEHMQPIQQSRSYTQPPVDYVVDQYGTRYYATDPAPPRATHATSEYRPSSDFAFERAPSRMIAPGPTQHASYVDPPTRYVEYVDPNIDRIEDQSISRAQATSYQGSYRPSTLQPPHAREGMPPPAPPPPAPAPYDPNYPAPAQPYGYYADGREMAMPTYVRQASAAPVRYVRQDAPPAGRAMSVIPQGGAAVPREHVYAPPPVRFVDQYGREVYPQEVRQVNEYRY